MIVDPDFLDHWRTRMVVDFLSDELGPLYLIRLWGHCQDRKADRFVMPVRGLKAQCRFPGEADLFETALSEAGFIQRDGDTVIVIGWAEKNASLIAAWGNGAKGGRPKNKPTANPSETHGKPNGNPSLTHAEPIRKDKRREELRGGEQRGEDSLSSPRSEKKDRQQKSSYTEDFESAWQAYPSRPGSSKADAFKAWSARLAEGAGPDFMIDAVKRYAAYCKAAGTDPQYIKQPSTFFGPGGHIHSDWTPPRTQAKGLDPAWAAFYARSSSNVIEADAKVIE